MRDEVHGPSPPPGHPISPLKLARLLAPPAQAALLIFLWGYWFFPDGWWHREFLLVLAAPLALAWLVTAKLATPSPTPWRDPWLALLAATLALTLILPSLAATPSAQQLGTQILDAALLVLLFAALRQLAASTPLRLIALRGMVISGLLAMALSLPLFYSQSSHFFPYARLRDMLVYYPDGLNPILTGMLAAAASSVALAFHLSSDGRARVPWLAAAAFLATIVFYTHSRGALLALGPGWLAATAASAARPSPGPLPTRLRLLARCLRLSLTPALALLAIMLFYLTYRPPLSPDQQASLGQHAARAASQPALSSLVDRGLAGRAEIHRAILGRMSPSDHLLGSGPWAAGTVDPPVISWHAHHPHSVWVGTYYYRGPLGTLLLLALVAWGIRRLWRAARSGDPAAAALFAWAISGLTGLILDGEDALTLASIPRIEPFLLLIPLALSTPGRAHEPIQLHRQSPQEGEGEPPNGISPARPIRPSARQSAKSHTPLAPTSRKAGGICLTSARPES
jgi:hypothetical protein